MLGVAGAASAATVPDYYHTVEFEDPYPPTDATVSLYNLQNNTEYDIEATKTGGGTDTVAEFETDSQGKARFTFNYKPFDREVKFQAGGYAYSLVDPSNFSTNINLDPYSTAYHGDTHADGTVQSDYDENKNAGFTESGGILEYGTFNTGVTYRGYNKLMDWLPRRESLHFRAENTGGSCQNPTKIRFSTASDVSGGQVLNDVVRNSDGVSEITINFSTEDFKVRAYNDGEIRDSVKLTQAEASTTYNWAWELTKSGSDCDTLIEFQNIQTHPRGAPQYWFNEKFRFPTGTSQVEAFEQPPGLVVDTQLSGPGFTTQFIDSVPPTSTINVTNLESIYNSFSIEAGSSDVFQDLEPADGRITNNNEITHSFTFNIPDGYDRGFLKLQYYRNGKWVDREAEFSGPGLCLGGFDTETTQARVDISFCDGKEIEITDGVDDLRGNVPWRIVYDNRNVLLASKNGVFYSEDRTFTRDVREPDFNLYYPPDNVTITSLKPVFRYGVTTVEPGTLRLLLNKTTTSTEFVSKSYQFDAPVTRTFNTSPSIGLDDGKSYLWSLAFDGRSGASFESEKRNITVNTSKDSELNATFYEPAEGAEILKRDAEVRLDLDASNSGTLKLFLNNREITSRDVSSGGVDNLTIPLLKPEVGAYSTHLTYDTGTTIFHEPGPSFEVVEDVNVTAGTPNGTVQSPPVVFRGAVNTSVSGTVELYVDGKKRKTQAVDEGANGVEFRVGKNLSAGRHAWRLVFESDASSNRFESSLVEFTLERGTREDTQAQGGIFGSALQNFIGDPMGLERPDTLTFAAVLLSLGLGAGAGYVSEEIALGGVGALAGLTAFALVGWFPAAFLVVIIVLAGVIVGKTVVD